MVEVLVDEKECTSWKEAISYMADTLYKRGLVHRDYGRACIEREEIFPTGFPGLIPVALPHANVCYVRKSGLFLLRFPEDVLFCRMDDPDQQVSCKMAFCAAIDNGDGHVELFKNLLTNFRDPDFLNQCLELPVEELQIYIERKLFDHEKKIAAGT